MNEIITKLNEIEEKANGLIEDAKSRKKQLEIQLLQDEKQLDEKYEAMQREKTEKLTEKLRGEAKKQIEEEREALDKAKENLTERFLKHQEEMALEVVHRILRE